MVKTLQIPLAALHDVIGFLLLAGGNAQLLVQGVNGIISIENGIGGYFKDGLHLDGTIFLGRHKDFAQTTEETFFLGLRHDCVPAGGNPALHTLLGDDGVLLGNDLLHLMSGNHVLIRLTQCAQQADSIGIFLPQKPYQAICPQDIIVVGTHKVLHLPVHEEQRIKQNGQQNSITGGYFLLGDVIHILSLFLHLVL